MNTHLGFFSVRRNYKHYNEKKVRHESEWKHSHLSHSFRWAMIPSLLIFFFDKGAGIVTVIGIIFVLIIFGIMIVMLSLLDKPEDGDTNESKSSDQDEREIP